MESNRNIKFPRIFFILIIVLILIFILWIKAYDDKTTHPALTDEIINLYNLRFDYKISNELKEEVIKGSRDEDIPPRWFNHFYDPAYNVGYKGYRISKDWAQYDVQDYSWNKAIEYYSNGDKKKAYYSLGHVLHLIEDATVPSHTRDDTHAGNQLPFGITGISSYEDWAEKFNIDNFNIAEEFLKNNEKIITFNFLDQYFDYLADYSNNNFFSDGTIFYEKYKAPIEFKKETDSENGFLYGYGVESLNNKLFRLVKYFSDEFIWRKDIKNTQVTIDDDLILSDYWSLLSKQAILAGVGVVDLFQKEAENAYQKRLQEEDDKTFFQEVIDKVKNPFNIISEFTASNLTNAKNIISTAFINSYFKIKSLLSSDSQTAGPFYLDNSEDLAETPISELSSELSDELAPNQDFAPIVRHSVSNNDFLQPIVNPAPAMPHVGNSVSDSAPTTPPYPGFGGGGTPAPAPEPEPEPEPEPPPPAPPAPPPGDTTSPDSPILTSPNDFSQPFTFSDITFIGTSEASSTISQDFDSATTTTDFSGNWSLALSLNQGTTTIQFFSADEAGNISSSTDVTLFIDSISPDIDSFSVSECSSSFSTSGCMVATTTLNISWQSLASDLDYYEFTHSINSGQDQTSTTTATSTIVSVSDGSTNNFFIRAKDITGQWSATTTQTVQISLMPVVINEVAWAGTSADRWEDEWIELYNRTDEEINLNNWVLYAVDGVPYINLSGTIAAKNYYLIERTDDTTISDITADLITPFSGLGSGSGLGNTGEGLILSFASSTVDQVPYCSNWCGGLDNPYYLSMERYDPDVFGSIPSNWGSNIYTGIIRNGKNADNLPINGTPKTRNSVNYLIANGQPYVSSDITLTKSNSPYLVNNQFQVFQAFSTLSIEPGVVIKFYNDAGMIIGQNAKILAQGTTTDPIVFTDLYDDSYGGDTNNDATSTVSAPGSWFGLRVESANTESVFDNVIVRYGGKWYSGSAGVDSRANLYVKETSSLITNSVFEYSMVHGLNLAISSSTVSNNIFRNNNNYMDPAGYDSGVVAEGGGSIIQNNAFINNHRGLFVNGFQTTVDSNTFTSNSLYAIYSIYTPPVFTNNSGSGNGTNGIVFYGGSAGITTANSTTTLKVNSLPYILKDIITVDATSTLVIEPGVAIKGEGGFWGGRLDVYGNLLIQGSDSNDIIFTSNLVTPAKGDWQGIRMYSGSSSEIKGVTFSYAETAITYTDSPINLENVSIENNTLGVRAVGNSPVQKAINVTFDNNTTDTDPLGLYFELTF